MAGVDALQIFENQRIPLTNLNLNLLGVALVEMALFSLRQLLDEKHVCHPVADARVPLPEFEAAFRFAVETSFTSAEL